MYKEVLENISGIGLYGIVSILIFFVFFSGVLVWACALSSKYLKNLGDLPLQANECPEPSTHKIQS